MPITQPVEASLRHEPTVPASQTHPQRATHDGRRSVNRDDSPLRVPRSRAFALGDCGGECTSSQLKPSQQPTSNTRPPRHHHPPPTMSTNMTQEPLSYASGSSPASPSSGRRMSAHAEADAARAMRRTNSWTPVYQRRQSWNKEDQKHAMQMATIDAVKTGPGFTERA
ncbi:hypothetical protein G7Z17_g6204 [Cylindrodendrum hubeiense]|uniref:Uncharacterized protein n=1 Tax=Cylindrodendrum hubeiense TaxID=595255 RepID=A0A9P5H558_9HYPO|nr:hypothetical protein G7Z17_g6204 [Cylindrodendrum hubeiense]